MRLLCVVAHSAFLALSARGFCQVDFTDLFDPPSSLWSNATGSWTASGGKYYAQYPNNNPAAVTYLPFDVTDMTVTVHVDNLSDGGIIMRESGGGRNVYLILGGYGYGQGSRGGWAGTCAYWHVNGSGALNLVPYVFTPGCSYDIRVTAVGDVCALYVDGGTSPVTTIMVPDNPHGTTGLYCDQPNTTSGSGFGDYMTFSNYRLVATMVLSGTVDLLDFGSPEGETIVFDVYAGGILRESKSAILDASGRFSIPVSVAGPYQLRAKGRHWLAQMEDVVSMSAHFTLVNGDVDGDNAVTVFDYNLLSDAFDSVAGDSNWLPDADLDGDGAVTVYDYNILSDKFDLVGD